MSELDHTHAHTTPSAMMHIEDICPHCQARVVIMATREDVEARRTRCPDCDGIVVYVSARRAAMVKKAGPWMMRAMTYSGFAVWLYLVAKWVLLFIRYTASGGLAKAPYMLAASFQPAMYTLIGMGLVGALFCFALSLTARRRLAARGRLLPGRKMWGDRVFVAEPHKYVSWSKERRNLPDSTLDRQGAVMVADEGHATRAGALSVEQEPAPRLVHHIDDGALRLVMSGI